MNYRRILILGLLISCLFGAVQARGLIDEMPITLSSDPQRVYHADSLRKVIYLNAGQLQMPALDGNLSSGLIGQKIDPETGESFYGTVYPANSGNDHIFRGLTWVGGIIGSDTLVSTSGDGWARYGMEILSEHIDKGGSYRTGNFSDDEFRTTLYDTFPNYPFADDDHIPLNIKVECNSHSWADTVYDDFVILEYTITNIGEDYISDACVGFLWDCDIYKDNIPAGYTDDLSGYLDTQLVAGDIDSRKFIGYSYDNDGEPNDDVTPAWDENSIRSSLSFSLLGSSFVPEYINFNWYVSNATTSLDYGPRRVGTPEDPLRYFEKGNLGTPVNDRDKYYILSHPERDFNQLETAIHDSSDGWIAPLVASQVDDFADGYDTRFLYSFGGFDLAPGETVEFTVALVGADNLHVNPSDFEDLFDPDNPSVFQNSLDFSELILHHQQAYEVYLSGLTLPHPGSPVGLEVADFDGDFVDLVWNASTRPDLAGYTIYYRDTVAGGDWMKANVSPVGDSSYTVVISDSLTVYEMAVATVDDIGRESAKSESIYIVPAAPKPITNPAIELVNKYPYVSWDAHPDVLVDEYVIYRAVWDEPFEKYASTSANYLYDYGVDRGYQYSYKIAAKSVLGIESALSDSVVTIPMDLTGGVLFINISNEFRVQPIYDHEAFLELYNSITEVIPADLHDTHSLADGPYSFLQMSHYSTVVLVMESREASLINSNRNGITTDSIANYLRYGGQAVFLALNATLQQPGDAFYRFSPGNIFYDVLKLDSAASRKVQLQPTIGGDLAGAESQYSDYPSLEADTTTWVIPFNPPYIPACGWVYPREGFVDTLYTYISSTPDTAHFGEINGIRYLGDDYQFILLNFPLSLMQGPDNVNVLEQALKDFGYIFNCGDANGDNSVNIGDIISLLNFIFYGQPLNNDPWYSDVNCNERIELADVVTLVNYIFKYKAPLNCCPVDGL